MKKQYFYLCLIAFAAGLQFSTAQDLHFSNYSYNELYLNPANTGAFYGTARIAGSYRDQYDAFIENGYNSQFIQIDMPLEFALSKNSWTGYGLAVYNDEAGDLGLQKSGAILSLAYHIALDKKYQQVLTIGGQIARVQLKINDPENAHFADGSGSASGDFNLINSFSDGYTDYNLGIKYKNTLSKTMKLEVGTAIYHFLKPAFRFNNGVLQNDINRRINFHGSLPILVNKQMIVEPRIVMSFMNKQQNIMAQTLMNYNYQNRIILKTGLGYRIQDAVQLLVGMEYKGWDIGLAYDVTISTARKYNNGRGGFEIGLKKIFKIPKEPKIIPVMICPRF